MSFKRKAAALLRTLLIGHSGKLTAFFVLLSLGGAYLGSGVALRLSLADLLPDDYPAVVKFNQLTEVVGGVGFLSVILTGESEKENLKIAPRIVEAVTKSPLVASASFGREKRFFVDRMLYYFPVEKLREMRVSMKKEVRRAKHQMFDMGLFDEPAKEPTKTFDDKMVKLAKDSSGITRYLSSKDGKHLLVMIKPTFDSTDLGKSKELIQFVESAVPPLLPAGVSFQLAERYYSKVQETQVLQQDIAILSAVALLLIALLLWGYLRSLVAVGVVLLPVLVGLGIMMGMMALQIGHINIVTGFLIGIISGLGVDYTVHLFLRYRLEQREPSSDEPDAAWRAISTAGKGVFLGAISAMGAFYLLAFSEFRAFSEFGLIAGNGILAVLLSLMATFKFMTRLYEKFNSKAVNGVQKVRPIPVLSIPRGLVAGGAITALLVVLAMRISFSYNFEDLLRVSDELHQRTELVNEIYGRSVVPSAVAVKSAEQAKALEEFVRARYMPSVVNDIVSGATIIPEDQEEKRQILAEMTQEVSGFKDKWLGQSLGIPGASVRRWLAAKPFTFKDIPPHVQDSLRGNKDGGYLIYLYPAVKLGVYSGIKALADMFQDIEREFPEVLSGSDAVIFADILNMVVTDGLVILAMIVLLVGVLIWVNVRRWDATLLTYIPLLLALPAGMGLMVLFGIEFNILNITLIPSFVALGIDVPIHIVHRARETGSGYKAAQDVAPAIGLSLATSGIGFGVLIFSRAGVLRSLGEIAILAIVAIYWAGLYLLPAVLEWCARRGVFPSMWHNRESEQAMAAVGGSFSPLGETSVDAEGLALEGAADIVTERRHH